MTGEWTAAAETLAETARESGFDVARTVASAWRARCLPEATRSLICAARALTSDDAKPRFWAREPEFRTAADFLAAVGEHEAEAAAATTQAANVAMTCEKARDRAIDAHEAAQRRARAARNDTEADEAREAMEATMQVIGDCEAALELISQVSDVLGYATRCFMATPGEYAEAYDVPLAFIAAGGVLPWSGDFLTGVIAGPCSPQAQA